MGSEPLFTTRTEWRNRVANVALVGEFDLAGVPTLEKDLAPVESNGVRAILLDLVEKVEVNRSYRKSDTLEVLRILKNYELLRDPQMDLLPARPGR